MPPKPTSPAVTKSGVKTDSTTGEQYIPASTRADGSVRKEIKVRPGYINPDDVDKYRSKPAESWRNRGKGGVPGAEAVEVKSEQSAAANKNAKRREARKKAAEKAREGEGDGEEGNANGDSTAASKHDGNIEAKAEVDPEEIKAKEAKKLAKKLRQARDLKDKKEKGDKLLPEQFEKVIRINELIRQLELLGYDINGEKKNEG